MGILNKTQKLIEIGCTNIEAYTLVSNYGYTFSKGGVKYDLRYWENCYGVYGGGWSVVAIGAPGSSPSFGENFDAVVEWIKENCPEERSCSTCKHLIGCDKYAIGPCNGYEQDNKEV
jgi:hypothetical protein